ncbi:DUF6127 family protein [Sphingobium aquiterrae]|uniref:DUF6127 family protein n=1 Tax=Sphingobium aquiterrae TaxID=2038656 RepID=UPI00301AADDC
MGDGEMLARLVAQAEGDGADLVMIRALVEEASEAGAGRALERVGLSDRGAADDVKELRELLRAWRDAKKSARTAAIGWLVRGVLALLLIGMAVKLGLFDLVRG